MVGISGHHRWRWWGQSVGTEDDIIFNKMATQALESVIPNLNTLALRGLGYNAPDMHAPDRVAQALKNFFL